MKIMVNGTAVHDVVLHVDGEDKTQDILAPAIRTYAADGTPIVSGSDLDRALRIQTCNDNRMKTDAYYDGIDMLWYGADNPVLRAHPITYAKSVKIGDDGSCSNIIVAQRENSMFVDENMACGILKDILGDASQVMLCERVNISGHGGLDAAVKAEFFSDPRLEDHVPLYMDGYNSKDNGKSCVSYTFSDSADKEITGRDFACAYARAASKLLDKAKFSFRTVTIASCGDNIPPNIIDIAYANTIDSFSRYIVRENGIDMSEKPDTPTKNETKAQRASAPERDEPCL